MNLTFDTPVSHDSEEQDFKLTGHLDLLQGDGVKEIAEKYGIDVVRFRGGFGDVSKDWGEENYKQYFDVHVRPYIEGLKNRNFSDNLSEEAELVAEALKGLFNNNKEEALVFLNSKIYYGSKTPSPIERLRLAYKRNKLDKYVVLLRETVIAYDQGAHF